MRLVEKIEPALDTFRRLIGTDNMEMRRANISPILVAGLLLAVYLAWFVAPLLWTDSTALVFPVGFDVIFSNAVSEITVCLVLLVLVAFLGWWSPVGLRSVARGGSKFVLLPLLYSLLLAGLAMSMVYSSSRALADVFGLHEIILSLLICFMVGFNEEVIFRGFVFHALQSVFSPFGAVLACGAVFGLFHLVNLVAGQALDVTLSQVVQAGAMGFMYACLRLRLSSIWPLILLHGLWDFSVTLMQEAGAQQDTIAHAPSGFHPGGAVPLILYGLYVYWRWSRSQQPSTAARK